jgi:PAS domain S-box-containing protein
MNNPKLIGKKFNMEQMLPAAFLAVSVLLVWMGLGSYSDAKNLVEMQDWLKRHIQAAFASDLVRSELSNARIEQTKYCLTGDPDYLQGASECLFAAASISDTGSSNYHLKLEPGTFNQAEELREQIESTLGRRQTEALVSLRMKGGLATRQKLKAELMADDDSKVLRALRAFSHRNGAMLRVRAVEFENQIQKALTSGTLFFALLGSIMMLVAAQRYVRAKRLAEETVFLSEQRIRAVADNMLDGLFAIDRDGVIVSTNSTAAALFAPRAEPLIGRRISELVSNARETRITQCTATKLNGETFTAEVAVSPLPPNVVQSSISAMVTVRDVTERVMAEKWRKDFVSTIGTDLFTPLSEVQSSLEAMRTSEQPVPEKISGVLNIAERNTTRLLELIKDLSDIESLESGTLQISPCMTSVDSIVERSVESVRALSERTGVAVTTDIQAPEAFADANRVVQVLVNLLSNAIKFSPRGAVVEVTAVPQAEETVLISVRDHGRGVPESARETIFERYKQAETDDAKKGTGLGLPICKMIVENHRGKIGVDSQPDQGSTFWFTLSMKALLSALIMIVSLQALPAQAQFLQVDQQPVTVSAKDDKAPGATPCMIWMDPEGPKKGVIVAVHGLGLHKGSYTAFAERMVKLGWAVYAPDVRGFGNFVTMEKGARHVDFEGCMKDVKEAIQFVHTQHPGMPVFLCGESMGGGISFQAASRYADMVNGVISSCPASRRHHALSAAVRVAGNLFTGKDKMDIRPILVEHSTKKQDLRDEWLKDSQARFDLAPVELIQFQLFMDKNFDAAKKMKKTPVMILQGTDDDLVKAENQRKLFADIPHEDKTLVYVDHAEHLILEEGQFNDGVIATVSDWLDSHIPKKVGSTP